jgi:glycerate-2-kinase
MGAFEDFVDIIRKTEAMQEILKNLVEEPAKLLASICEEYEDTDKPVPDHHLLLVGQTGETAVKVLLSANMITKETGQFSLYSYKPTELGLTYCKKMRAEQTHPEKQPEVV